MTTVAPRIVFCGVGALGTHAAVLCRNLEAVLVFVDFDRVESKNVLAQGYVKQSIGKNKAEALKAQFLNFYGVKVESFGVRVTAENVATLCGGASLVVDCFDNAASRRVLGSFAGDQRVPLVHAAVAADGTFGLVRWHERFVADEEASVGQPTCEGGAHLPFLGQVGAALARVIQDFVLHGTRRDVMVGLAAVTTIGA